MICDECKKEIGMHEMYEHYWAGASHPGHKKDVGVFCMYCLSELELNDAIELRKAEENIRVHESHSSVLMKGVQK